MAAGMNGKLVATLASADKPTEAWKSPDGTVALVLPYGGRILGLFTPGSERNFFWTHPALAAAETARDFYKSAQWHNSGGDRTWLAPEVDFFFPNFPNLEPYWQPREFDPGNYQVTRSNGSLVLEYHVPAIGGPGGEHACEDVSQVWAFRGQREDILEAARMLIYSDV